MDPQIVAAYIGLTGVGIGILFSGLAYFWKVRSEQKRIINKILYFLLEVRHEIKLNYLTVAKMSRYYQNLLTDFFTKRGFDITQIPKESLQPIEVHFENIISSLKTPGNYSIEKYQELIVSLAETKPLLAFKLSSINIFPSLVNQNEKYKAQLPSILNEKQFTPEVEEIANGLSDDAIHQLMNELNRLVLFVAFNCGIMTFIYFYIAIKLSRKPKISLSDAEKNEFENAMAELLAVYVQQLTKT
jgi:hypothetical protein